MKSILFKSKTDWMAVYNRYLEEQGESSKIGCLINDTESGQSKRREFTHCETDGLACLVVGLREKGIQVDEFPRVSFKRHLSIFKKIELAFEFIKREVGPVRPLV